MKNLFAFVIYGSAWWAGACASALGAILSSVPMQGTMIMPKIYYHASNGTLTISLNSKVPQLTPAAGQQSRRLF